MAQGGISGTRQAFLAACLCIAALVSATGCGSQSHHRVVLPAGTTFSVTVTTDRTGYRASQPVGVTVQNASGTTYYAQDGRSACTILELQEMVKGTWRDEMPCASGQAPNLLLVAPRSSVPFTLAPGNARGDPNSWELGIYRVAMVLQTKPDDAASTIQVHSAAFQVTA